jgi:hypothetical protein
LIPYLISSPHQCRHPFAPNFPITQHTSPQDAALIYYQFIDTRTQYFHTYPQLNEIDSERIKLLRQIEDDRWRVAALDRKEKEVIAQRKEWRKQLEARLGELTEEEMRGWLMEKVMGDVSGGGVGQKEET